MFLHQYSSAFLSRSRRKAAAVEDWRGNRRGWYFSSFLTFLPLNIINRLKHYILVCKKRGHHAGVGANFARRGPLQPLNSPVSLDGLPCKYIRTALAPASDNGPGGGALACPSALTLISSRWALVTLLSCHAWHGRGLGGVRR
jgi:hypothetical protein